MGRVEPRDQPGDVFAAPRTATAALYFDGPDHVLLVNPTYKDLWDLPGGYLMPGETPTSALHREILEELGTPLPFGDLLVVDWAPNDREDDKVLWVFDGGELTAEQEAAIRVDGKEISEFDLADATPATTWRTCGGRPRHEGGRLPPGAKRPRQGRPPTVSKRSAEHRTQFAYSAAAAVKRDGPECGDLGGRDIQSA